MRITHVVETHVQADHLSGARHLGSVTGAPVLLHESAKVRFPHVAVEDGEDHEMGNVRMAILHTPGHTPESISILVTDRSRAVEPWFVLTGDARRLLWPSSSMTACSASCSRCPTTSRSIRRTSAAPRAARA